jgi:hypothetical protein
MSIAITFPDSTLQSHIQRSFSEDDFTEILFFHVSS